MGTESKIGSDEVRSEKTGSDKIDAAVEHMESIKEKIRDAELVLVGIGEMFSVGENLREAYEKLARLLDGKNYFVISTCSDGLLSEAGLKKERIVQPLTEGEDTKEWETYMKWLQGTLNRKLFVLELGVGLKYPNVIRFPFEKIAYFNQKSDFFRIHDRLFQLPAELNGKGTSIAENPVELLAQMEI